MTKRAVVDRRTKKSTKKVLFRFNPVQRLLAEYFADRWSRKLGIRCLIPKARQMGVSTFWQAIFFALCVLKPGYRAIVVAHTEKDVGPIFGKSRCFQMNLTDDFRKPLANMQGGLMAWVDGSEFAVGSVGAGGGLKRGDTLSGAHFSEVARYAVNGMSPDEAEVAVMNSLADGEDAIVVWESTAQGRDVYFFEKCEAAKDPSRASEEELIFLGWFMDSSYSMTWERYRGGLLDRGKDDPGRTFVPTEEEAALRAMLAAVEPKPHERYYRHRVSLTNEQLIYYRWLLENKCRGRADLLRQEYPSTLEEAFSSTTRSFFDAETQQHYLNQSRNALAVGNLVPIATAPPQFVFHPLLTGRVRLWEHPLAGTEYVIGVDVGGEERGDPHAACVLDRYARRVVATLHGYMQWDELVGHVSALGYYYNRAELVVENNNNPAVAGQLFKDNYPNLYHYADEFSTKAGVQGRPGYNTNRKTREELTQFLGLACRSRRLINPDAGFAREMPLFVWNEAKGRFQASGRKNHDDRILATAFAVIRCPVDRPILGPQEREQSGDLRQALRKAFGFTEQRDEEAPPIHVL
jgi:hypothetical protein